MRGDLSHVRVLREAIVRWVMVVGEAQHRVHRAEPSDVVQGVKPLVRCIITGQNTIAPDPAADEIDSKHAKPAPTDTHL